MICVKNQIPLLQYNSKLYRNDIIYFDNGVHLNRVELDQTVPQEQSDQVLLCLKLHCLILRSTSSSFLSGYGVQAF